MATVVGAAVGALVGKLTAYLFVAAAIFLFAVAATVLYSRARTPTAEGFKRRFLIGVALTAALLGCGTLAYGIPNELTKGVRSEEKLVSSLSAGQDLSRFRATLGTPDTKRPAGDFLVYQFRRSRATLQASSTAWAKSSHMPCTRRRLTSVPGSTTDCGSRSTARPWTTRSEALRSGPTSTGEPTRRATSSTSVASTRSKRATSCSA